MSTFQYRSGTSWVTPTTKIKRWNGGSTSWNNINKIRRMSGGSWVLDWLSPVTVSVSPATANGTVTNNNASSVVTSNPVTATGSGGTGSYTYSWTIDNSSITINTPSSANTTFGASVNLNSAVSGNATIHCSDGNTIGTAVVPVQLIHNSTS